MPTTYECLIEDQDKKFQITIEGTPRMGEYLVRGGTQYVVAAVTWNVSQRRSFVQLLLREIPPPP